MSSPRLVPLRGAEAIERAGGALDPALVAIADRLAPMVAERLVPFLTPAPTTSLIDVDLAAKLLDVPASWLAAEARRGKFRSYKHGHYRRYDPREVVEDFKRLAGSGELAIQHV